MPKILKIYTNLRNGGFFAKLKPLLLTAFSFVLPLFLSACKFTILDPKGRIAADEKYIMLVSVLVMLLVVVPVILLTFAFAWRYRASNVKAKYQPNWEHSTTLELIWWTIPCLIIAFLGAVTWISSHKLDPYRPLAANTKQVITIQAVALEWKWLFIYPEQNIASVNFVHVPVGVPVRFIITSEGPMNSLQVPQLGGQIYAMAGMQTKLHLIADAAGDYQGISANFSGNGFSDMKFTMHAGTQAEFDQWVKAVKKAPEKLTMTTYKRLAQASVNKEVKYYSSAHKDLFETVVMKSMMPMPGVTEELAQK